MNRWYALRGCCLRNALRALNGARFARQAFFGAFFAALLLRLVVLLRIMLYHIIYMLLYYMIWYYIILYCCCCGDQLLLLWRSMRPTPTWAQSLSSHAHLGAKSLCRAQVPHPPGLYYLISILIYFYIILLLSMIVNASARPPEFPDAGMSRLRTMFIVLQWRDGMMNPAQPKLCPPHF